MADRTVWVASQAGCLDELAQLPPEIFDRVTLERALHVAAANDHAEIVRFLLRAGVNKNSAHLSWGASVNLAARSAARHDSANALRALIKAKARVHRDRDWPAVVAAAEHGATARAQVLALAKADLDATRCNGLTALGAAAQNGDISMLHLLLQHKASLDMQEPITSAARNGHMGAVYALILAKADIESAQCRESPPLYAAAKYGHVGTMLLLLQAKADTRYCRSACYALSVAASANGGHTAAVRCLLQHAPDLAAMVTREDIRRRDAL